MFNDMLLTVAHANEGTFFLASLLLVLGRKEVDLPHVLSVLDPAQSVEVGAAVVEEVLVRTASTLSGVSHQEAQNTFSIKISPFFFFLLYSRNLQERGEKVHLRGGHIDNSLLPSRLQDRTPAKKGGHPYAALHRPVSFPSSEQSIGAALSPPGSRVDLLQVTAIVAAKVHQRLLVNLQLGEQTKEATDGGVQLEHRIAVGAVPTAAGKGSRGKVG